MIPEQWDIYSSGSKIVAIIDEGRFKGVHKYDDRAKRLYKRGPRSSLRWGDALGPSRDSRDVTQTTSSVVWREIFAPNKKPAKNRSRVARFFDLFFDIIDLGNNILFLNN